MNDQNTILQEVFASYNVRASELYLEIAEIIAELIKNGRSIKSAIDIAFDRIGYNDRIKSIMSEGIYSSALGASAGTKVTIEYDAITKYFLKTQFAGGANLSDRLHSADAKRIINATLQEAIQRKNNAYAFARELTSRGAVSFDKFPRALRDVIDMPDSTQAMQDAANYVKSLSGIEESSERLKKAYSNLLEAVKTGDAEVIAKATKRAVNGKVAYHNKRIARSEFARSYEMTFNRTIDAEDRIVGYRVLLSSRHPRYDQCNIYAEADLYGYGPGVYPKDIGAEIPFHPNCLCSKVPVMRFKEGSGRYSDDRMKEYIGGLSEEKRKSIIGSTAASSESSYISGVNNSGFRLIKRPRMIPESTYTIAES